ncbi:uncharacterized protein LOC143013063 [Genypterus blacodes]|uniref:uncharacterized protein LOC143013063 n=1 Tax=Genypterus blacodes TaxID=154954 RepID=UPI003F76B730
MSAISRFCQTDVVSRSVQMRAAYKYSAGRDEGRRRKNKTLRKKEAAIWKRSGLILLLFGANVIDMAEEIQLLRSLKVKLIDILSADADFVLQHTDSRFLLSPQSYEQINVLPVPSQKVTALLDHIIKRGPEAARGLLQLLKDPALQETFPMLGFLKDVQGNMLSTGEREMPRNREEDSDLSPKKMCKNSSVLVSEKQLMMVARGIGRSWKVIGTLVLDITAVKLEQIEEDHSIHMDRVFAMLRHWRVCQKENATADYLHSLLSQEVAALPCESIDFLLD